MPNELGISFSPFGQPDQGQQQGPGGRAASPQDAIRVLSFRPPRTVGASSPVAAPLLNAPGAAAFGGGSFGPAGGNLDQLLALIFGLRKPMQPGGSGSFNERPPQGDLSALFGGNGGGATLAATAGLYVPVGTIERGRLRGQRSISRELAKNTKVLLQRRCGDPTASRTSRPVHPCRGSRDRRRSNAATGSGPDHGDANHVTARL
jgi:hypothetical protein